MTLKIKLKCNTNFRVITKTQTFKCRICEEKKKVEGVKTIKCLQMLIYDYMICKE